MKKNGTHYIAGCWMEGSDSGFFSENPATGETIWKGKEALPSDIDLAVGAAKEAFHFWKQLPLEERAQHLRNFGNCVKSKESLLAETISQETGKPLWESKAEVHAVVNKIDISIDAYQERCKELVVPHPQYQSITRHQPHGVMAVLGPYNFPAHLPNGHIVPALLAGNTIVFKPSELTPLTGQKIIECWEESKIPHGTINLVQGGRTTGEYLSEHPYIDGLLFTGSWRTGQHLAQTLAKTPYKMLALEMGGNNPLVIGSIQDVEAAALLTIQSAFLTSGQRCTCARRLILPKGKQWDTFLEALLGWTAKIKIGSYQETPEPFMGPLINKAAAEIVIGKYEEMIKRGGKPLYPLKRLKQGAAFISPSIVDVTAILEQEDEEIFGPLLQVIRVDNFEETIHEANKTRYGLSAGLLSDDKDEYLKFQTYIQAGIVNWNAPLTGASSAAPFGGIKQSGNNRPSAYYAADYCAYPVASMEAKNLKMPSSIPPGLAL